MVKLLHTDATDAAMGGVGAFLCLAVVAMAVVDALWRDTSRTLNIAICVCLLIELARFTVYLFKDLGVNAWVSQYDLKHLV